MLYRKLLRPLLFKLPPETAHELALHALTLGLGAGAVRAAAARRYGREAFGEIRRFGLSFRNPVGLAVGFDKNGVAARELAALGFGFVEVGTVTNLPQPGNPRPRLFRLPLDRALINRQGFNNEGAAALAQRRNRELAARDARLPVPLLVKVAPDLGAGELELIVDVARRAEVAGIIATNTTTGREGLRTPRGQVAAFGEGGLSGAPLRRRSTEVVAALRRLTRGALVIVGVGGVFTAEDAWEKICAGAGLVQLYTGFVYEGFGVVRRINEGLAALLRRHGFRTLDEAVGCRADELAAAAR